MRKDVFKKGFLLFVICLFLCNEVAYAGCDALLTVEAAEFISEIVKLIRIAVPILLIVLCSSDFISVIISQDDNAIKKSASRIVKRFIAAAAIFFVPLIIEFILGIDAIKNSLNLVDDPTCGIVSEE